MQFKLYFIADIPGVLAVVDVVHYVSQKDMHCSNYENEHN